MAEQYKFFNSSPNDKRTYRASDFADYFGTVLSTGLISVNEDAGLEVTHVQDLTVSVSSGKAIFKGRMYENTSDAELELDIPETDLDRIDRVVLRLDLSNSERNIKLDILKGSPDTDPNPPTLTRDEFVYELSLAQIFLERNTASISDDDITDERLDEDVCGLTNSLLTVPTSQFVDEWNTFFDATKDDISTEEQLFYDDLANKIADAQTELDDYNQTLDSKLSEFEDEFNTWFDDLQNNGYASQTEHNNLQDEVTEHKAEQVHEGETHGFRLKDGKLEYYDGTNWQRVKGDGYPVGNVYGLSSDIGNGEVTIYWQDPDDVTVEDSNGNVITIAKWARTKLVRKTGSYPVDENDGTVLIDNTTKNQYSSSGYTDTNLTNGTTYYYMLFPKSEEDVVTNDSANRINATPQAYDDLTGSPGPKNLIGGDMQAGYFGEVSSAELISGDALSSDLGLTAGTAQHSDAGWLKFAYQGNIQFVAKKTFRYDLSWDNIDAVNAVFGTDVTVEDQTYSCRLIRGAENDPFNYNDADKDAIGSEWNALMLPIHEHAGTGNWEYPDYVDIPTEDWGINFTDEDLLTHRDFGDGSYSWGQETRADDTSRRVVRGYYGVSGAVSNTSSSSYSNYGWRPVLELL